MGLLSWRGSVPDVARRPDMERTNVPPPTLALPLTLALALTLTLTLTAADLYDPFGFLSGPAAKKEAGLIKEINNGRLAMIGIFGFICEPHTPHPHLASPSPRHLGFICEPHTPHLVPRPPHPPSHS